MQASLSHAPRPNPFSRILDLFYMAQLLESRVVSTVKILRDLLYGYFVWDFGCL